MTGWLVRSGTLGAYRHVTPSNIAIMRQHQNTQRIYVVTLHCWSPILSMAACTNCQCDQRKSRSIAIVKKWPSKGRWYAPTCVTPGVTVRGFSIGMTPYHSMNIIHRNSASFLQEGICPLSDWRLEISHLRNNIYFGRALRWKSYCRLGGEMSKKTEEGWICGAGDNSLVRVLLITHSLQCNSQLCNAL